MAASGLTLVGGCSPSLVHGGGGFIRSNIEWTWTDGTTSGQPTFPDGVQRCSHYMPVGSCPDCGPSAS